MFATGWEWRIPWPRASYSTGNSISWGLPNSWAEQEVGQFKCDRKSSFGHVLQGFNGLCLLVFRTVRDDFRGEINSVALYKEAASQAFKGHVLDSVAHYIERRASMPEVIASALVSRV